MRLKSIQVGFHGWRRGVITGMISSVFAIGLGGCVTNEATGRSIFAMMSPQEEIALGAEAAGQFTQEYGGAVQNTALNQYVTDLGQQLASKTEGNYPSYPWEFTLLNSDVVNAFALPGGKVFVSKGLAQRLTNEAQLAGVMGHEIGHVTAQHGNQRISSQTAFNIGLSVAAVVVSQSDNKQVQNVGTLGIPALQIGGNLVMLKYGRDEELEADRLGVRYMTRCGYNPIGQMQVMQILQSLSANSERQPEFLSTHPDPAARVAQIQKMLAGEYAYTQNNPEYRLEEQRFRSQFLATLAKMEGRGWTEGVVNAGVVGSEDPTAVLGPPSMWCAHCAAEARDAKKASPTAHPAVERTRMKGW